MDSPTLEHAEHLRALEGLRRINRASGAAAPIAKWIVAFARRENLARLSVLDVACGGGDVPVEVAVAAKGQGVEIDLALFDRSETAVRQASQAATAAGVAHRGLSGDAVAGLPAEKMDIVINSLFLHHLTEAEVVAVLTNMRKTAGRAVVVSDLRRSVMGYVIAWVGCRVLSRSPVVHYDGPVSVRAAWTVGELTAMAERAGMYGVRVERAWPWRMLLTWERADGEGRDAE